MGLITLNLKRVLNWNFIFMSAVAAIFGMISLMNFGDISENIVFGVDIKYFMLDGYLCLFIYFLILSILYSAFINVLILWIRNMNWFKSIPIFATLLHILLVVLKCGIFMKTNNVWVLLLFSPVSIIVLTACGLCLMTKERIVSSYY